MNTESDGRDAAQRQIAELKARVEAGDATIAAIQASRSWRITAPLRGAISLVGAVWRPIRLKIAIRRGDGWELPASPLISVLLAAHDTPPTMLDAAIRSVRRQTYPRWELCAVADASTPLPVRKILERHAAKDHRIRIAFRDENGNIPATLNTALAMARGDSMAVLDPDGLLHPRALYEIAKTIAEHPEADYIYTDEDQVSADGARFFEPFHKPDWSPEYLHTFMYTGRLGAYRTGIAKAIGGYRSEFGGAQDFDFTLRFLLRGRHVEHVPRVLYHARARERSIAQSIEPAAEGLVRRALEEYLTARGENFRIGPGARPDRHEVQFLPRGAPLVSIVIPTANGTIEIDGRTQSHIDAAASSIVEKTHYTRYEIVVVHDGDLPESQASALEALGNVRRVRYDAPEFNRAEKIDLGCRHALGEYLVIMDDHIRVVTPEWLGRMLGMAQREGIGAVGPKLLFPDGRIQQAGVVLLGGAPMPAYSEWPGDAEGHGLGAAVARNCIAVSGACLMVAKRLFDDVGGFALRYPHDYGDVDFCLKLRELGYRSVYLPQAVLCRYEGVPGERDRSVDGPALESFRAEWSAKLPHDPYYNPDLGQSTPYYSIGHPPLPAPAP